MFASTLGSGAHQCSAFLNQRRAGLVGRSQCSHSSKHPLAQNVGCLCTQNVQSAARPHTLVCDRSSNRPCRRRAASLLPNAVVQEADSASSSGALESATNGANKTPASTIPSAEEWELDFCSRPMLDERGKKVWELIICDAKREFEYSRYFPNNKINSGELKRAIQAILAQEGAVQPKLCRFFRGQMQTIITKALTELEIKAVPSRRCFTIMSWLKDRIDTVYSQDPRYQEGATSLFQLDLPSPEPLPDALRGEQWAFVQLPLALLQEMLQKVETGDVFGSTVDLATVGADKLAPNALIPGVAVFTRRALPLAAWTNGLELAALKADVERACLILETGVNQRWRYGAWRATPESTVEAESWEDAKNDTKGLHFLAVQPDPESEVLTGLWLLYDQPPPNI